MVNKELKSENLEFGISVLHGWICFLKCLLHLAYKRMITKWQARGDDREVVAERIKYPKSTLEREQL